ASGPAAGAPVRNSGSDSLWTTADQATAGSADEVGNAPVQDARRLGPLKVVNGADAGAEIRSAPLRIITPPLAVGVNPEATVHLVVTTVQQVHDQLGLPGKKQ